MPRIAVAGFQHETNIFVDQPTTLAEFTRADSWPALLRGPEVLSDTRGLNLPIAGAIAALETWPAVEILPLLWCAAEPSGPVTREAFDTITNEILDGLNSAGPIDALYLDLHGAMVIEDHPDGESLLLNRIRGRMGPDLPIAVSLDNHANIGAQTHDLADLITLYRSYPHLDMAETGARAIALLRQHLTKGKLAKAFRPLPYLIPLPAQHSETPPLTEIYDHITTTPKGTSLDLAVGFTAADSPCVGPSVVAYAATQPQAEALADHLVSEMNWIEPDLITPLLTPAQAVTKADASSGRSVIADVQDNPGAGASSDTTGLLKALAATSGKPALLGLMADPTVAQMAIQAGLGAEISHPLGGNSGWPGDTPYTGAYRVTAIGPGHCTYTGEMYGGGTAILGHTAALDVLSSERPLTVVVTQERSQCLDRALFEHLGLDLSAFGILVVKSTLHYRADFDPLADQTLACAAPGAFPCELSKVPYKNLRPNLRLGPMDEP